MLDPEVSRAADAKERVSEHLVLCCCLAWVCRCDDEVTAFLEFLVSHRAARPDGDLCCYVRTSEFGVGLWVFGLDGCLPLALVNFFAFCCAA